MCLLSICVILSVVYPSIAQIDTTYSELRGLEDTLGNTHLYYRMHYEISDSVYWWWYNSIFHYDISNNSDSLFLQDYNYDWPYYSSGQYIADYEFWDNQPGKFIYGGAYIYFFDATPFISRFDVTDILPPDLSWFGPGVDNLEISGQNDSLIYAGLSSFLIKSNNGGYSWMYDSLATDYYTFLKLCPFNDQILFSQGEDSNTNRDVLYKSVDGGNTYYPVDSTQSWWYYYTSIEFDADSLHVFAISWRYPRGYSCLISDDLGDSWNIRCSDSSSLRLAVDPGQSGMVYLATGSRIAVSSDYGHRFTDYVVLNRPVVGMYKKPATDLLYVATTKDIFEISPRGVVSIKSLPVAIEPQSKPILSDFKLYQNYPNPFNPTTTITFDLPESGPVALKVYNILGEEVSTLLSASLHSGFYEHKWDGSNFASGIYLYRLQVGNYVETKKMVLIH
jgi:hypothetical protein